MYNSKKRRIAVYLQREASLDDKIASCILLKKKPKSKKLREQYNIVKYKTTYSWYFLPRKKNLFKLHRYVYMEWFNKHFFHNWFLVWNRANHRRIFTFLHNSRIPIKIDAKNSLYRNAYVPEFKIKKKARKLLFNVGLFYGFTKRHKGRIRSLFA